MGRGLGASITQPLLQGNGSSAPARGAGWIPGVLQQGSPPAIVSHGAPCQANPLWGARTPHISPGPGLRLIQDGGIESWGAAGMSHLAPAHCLLPGAGQLQPHPSNRAGTPCPRGARSGAAMGGSWDGRGAAAAPRCAHLALVEVVDDLVVESLLQLPLGVQAGAVQALHGRRVRLIRPLCGAAAACHAEPWGPRGMWRPPAPTHCAAP